MKNNEAIHALIASPNILTYASGHGKSDRFPDRSFYPDILLTCEETDETRWQKITINRCKEIIPIVDKASFIFDAIKAPMVYTDGKRLGLLVIDDIPEQEPAEKELRHLLEQKDLLIKELHHRVKNNFNVISNLLSFEKDKLSDDNSIQVFNNAISRIHSMAGLYSQLCISKDMIKIDLSVYIKNLTDSIFQTYVIDKTKIHLLHSTDEVHLDMDRAVPLGLILNELIANALKYAYPNNKEGEVRISLKKIDQDVLLCVEDDGIGLSDEMDPHTTDSLGLTLIKMLSKQIDATLQIKNKNGLKVSVFFKI